MSDILDTHEISLIISNTQYQSIRPFILELVTALKNTKDNKKIFEIEIKILNKILTLERDIRALKSTSNRTTHNKDWLLREIYKEHRLSLKKIMDGVAWRLLLFDRSSLRLIADHNQTGHIEKGILKEFEEAEEIVSSTDYFVILNDITNFLRYGDLTVITPDKNIIQEVKTSRVVAGHQKKKIKEVIKMLNEKKFIIGETEALPINIPLKPINFFPKVRDIIKKAYISKEGIYADRVSPYLWISCSIFSKVYNFRRTMARMPIFPSSPFPIDDYYAPYNSTFSLFGDFSPNTAPILIYPFDNEVVVDIILGNIQFNSVVSRKYLTESFKGKGWNFSSLSKEQLVKLYNVDNIQERIRNMRNPNYHPSLERNGFVYRIPLEVILRISTEFLSAKTLVETAEYLMSTTSKEESRSIAINYTREKEIWS